MAEVSCTCTGTAQSGYTATCDSVETERRAHWYYYRYNASKPSGYNAPIYVQTYIDDFADVTYQCQPGSTPSSCVNGSKMTLIIAHRCQAQGHCSDGTTRTVTTGRSNYNGDIGEIIILPNQPPAEMPQSPAIAPPAPEEDEPVSCTNCPGLQVPEDPDGDTVALRYRWRWKHPGENWNYAGAWSGSPGTFTCEGVAGCEPLDLISLSVKACDGNGNCNMEAYSNSVEVFIPPPPPPPPPPPEGTDEYVWIVLAVAVSATFIGLAYMAAKLFGIQMLEAWVKIEIGELAAAVVIAVFCIALIASVNSAAQFLSGEGGATEVAGVAQDFLRTTVYGNGREIYLALANFYFDTARVESYSYTAGISIGIFSASVSESPASGISGLVAQIGQGVDTVSGFMLLAAAQYSFLGFFRSASIVMLPVGIVLRSFSLTRKIGGLVLAAVIATAVIYPASYIVSKEIYGVYSGEMMNGVSKIKVDNPPGNPPLSSVVCNTYVQMFLQSPLPVIGGEVGWTLTICTPLAVLCGPAYASCWETCRNIVFFVYPILKATFGLIMFPFLLGYAGKLAPNEIASNFFDPLQQYALPAVAKYSVLSLVVFLIPLIITMPMIRNLAASFGGETQLYGLSKLV